VVRVAVKVDPATAQITAVSDPLPHIQEGIPLRLRSIRVSLDRPDFTLNPTNCKASTIAAQISGDQGAQAGLSTHFQVSNCAVLPFAPRFSLRLTGGLNRRGHPAIHALLRTRSGEANSHSVSLTLPAGEIIDNAHIGTPCTQPQFSSGTCAASSLLGSAEAVTPLLDQPLKGNVYLRTNPAHKLPDLVADLRGQIDIELVGHISTAGNGALRTTFANVPDAEDSSFALNLDGGTKGLLQNSRDLCGQTREATLKMTGQNGDQVNTTVPLLASCKRSSRRKATHQQPGGLRP
jgi:hypothetical protein